MKNGGERLKPMEPNAITIPKFKASTISSSEDHIQNKIVVNKFFAIILTFVAIFSLVNIGVM